MNLCYMIKTKNSSAEAAMKRQTMCFYVAYTQYKLTFILQFVQSHLSQLDKMKFWSTLYLV